MWLEAENSRVFVNTQGCELAFVCTSPPFPSPDKLRETRALQYYNFWPACRVHFPYKSRCAWAAGLDLPYFRQ